MKSRGTIIVRPCRPLDLFFIYKSYLEECGPYYRDNVQFSCFIGRSKSAFDSLMFFIKNFRSLKNPQTPISIVTIDGKNAGFWIARARKEDKTKLFGGTICICEKFQGKGFGAVVYDKIFKEARIKGFTEYGGYITSDNKISIKFHKKIGFVKTERIYLVLVELDKIDRDIPVELRFSKYFFHKVKAFFFYCSSMPIIIDNKVKRITLMNNFLWQIEESIETWEEIEKICSALRKIDKNINKALFKIHNPKLFPKDKVKLVRTLVTYIKKLTKEGKGVFVKIH